MTLTNAQRRRPFAAKRTESPIQSHCGRIRSLVLTPTRALAAQIADSVSVYGRYLKLCHALVYEGVSQRHQEIALRVERLICPRLPVAAS